MPDIHEIFITLRKTARKECLCGNNDFIAPVFHESGCPYIPIAEKNLDIQPEAENYVKP